MRFRVQYATMAKNWSQSMKHIIITLLSLFSSITCLADWGPIETRFPFQYDFVGSQGVATIVVPSQVIGDYSSCNCVTRGEGDHMKAVSIPFQPPLSYSAAVTRCNSLQGSAITMHPPDTRMRLYMPLISCAPYARILEIESRAD